MNLSDLHSIIAMIGAFLIGACMGSFINAVAMRTVLEKKWWGSERSLCDSCGETLEPRDLVPIISYLLLKGKCRHCGKRIPVRHFAAELVSAVLTAALLCFALIFSALPPVTRAKTNSEDAWELAREAYVYALPLVLVDATAKASTNTETATPQKAPVNQFIHASQLLHAGSKMVVTPNVDTIYSSSFLDLSSDAMVFHKPASDRFLAAELMDAYTNCVALMGTGSDTDDAKTYLLTGPDFKGSVPKGLTEIKVPTNNAWLLIRSLINDEADMPNVRALQDGMRLIPLSHYLSGEGEYKPEPGTYSPEYDYVPIQHVLKMTPQEFFTKANELMKLNPPAPNDADLLKRFAGINVGAGLDFDVSVLGGGAQKAWADMLEGMRERLTNDSAEFIRQMGAWTFWGEPIAEFGTEYDYRALIALAALAANPVRAAIYPRANTDSSGAVLDGTKQYRIRFKKGMLPPTGEQGFWSITAYGENDFLIDNELDRYLINDRSDVVYNADGSLDILLSSTPPKDKAMLNNWLPVKAEQFHLYMRIYLPDESVFNGDWEMPLIERVGAAQ